MLACHTALPVPSRRLLLAVLLLVAAVPTVAVATPVNAAERAPRCDPIDPKACLLPFPNDYFTVADSTPTGRRVDLNPLAMPRNAAGKPIDPSEWNRNDGFSPSTPALTYVPGLDLHATWGSRDDTIAHLDWYQRPDAPIVILDATTGTRYPFWSELDQHPGTTDANRLLILRPAVQFVEGHRYVVALRNLRNATGGVIGPDTTFSLYRDHMRPSRRGRRAFEARRPHMERLFRDLTKAGVDRGTLYQAWDFTVASRKNLTERVLHMRDETFAGLGDRDLGDRVISGAPPAFTITKVEDVASGATMRHVEGTISVPNYLTPQVEIPTTYPEPVGNLSQLVKNTRGQLPAEVTDALKPVTGALPVDVADLLENPAAVPDSRFWRNGRGNLPSVDPLQPTVSVPFMCNIARGSDTQPSHPFLYGHGLLGNRDEANGGSTQRLRERGFSPCAVDWWGFSSSDLAQVGLTLTDLSHMGGVVDRAQQGFLNFLVLGRALSHAGGFAANAAFRSASGKPLIRTNELFYDGNSQGAIMGGALTALAPDLRRSVLGVAGMAYSTLLNRSVDWEGKYAIVYQTAYPDPIDEQIGYVLLQMLWDRAESAGYAQQMTSRPLPHTPSHDVMLQIAFGDHQVANVAAEVEGRTIGARFKTPALAPGRHWAADPTFGFNPVSGDEAGIGSVLVYWYAEGRGLATPPNGNLPDGAGSDPHGVPRSYGPATDQVAHFLLTGDLIDVCAGAPCVVPKT